MTEREIAEYFRATITVKRNLYLKLQDSIKPESVEEKLKRKEYEAKAQAFTEIMLEVDRFSSMFEREKKEIKV